MNPVLNHAVENLLALRDNPYPGRGIVMGRTAAGDLVQVYWIMGRSTDSRNRVLVPVPGKSGWLRTCLADPSKFTGNRRQLTWILYTAMAEKDDEYVVSNGKQTIPVLRGGIEALKKWHYEDDAPNYTPRITGVIRCYPDSNSEMQLAILRKSPFGNECDRFNFAYGQVDAGFGYHFSTYQGDGKPLPSFRGEPLIMPIGTSNVPMEIAEMYQNYLNPDNLVAVVVKLIRPGLPSEVAVINRYPHVQAA